MSYLFSSYRLGAIVCLFSVNLLFSQVGVNTSSPSATLDVDGNVLIDETLTLENPGNSLKIRGLNLLVRSTTDEILQYDIEQSKYGPINSAQFEFIKVSTNGLQDYDTKVSIDDYEMVVHSYYFKRYNETSYGVLEQSSISTLNVEGYQIYAYKNTTTNTWFLRAFVNNATFQKSSGGYANINIDMYLNIVVYRLGLLTKKQSDVNVNMSGNSTGTAPLPTGFIN